MSILFLSDLPEGGPKYMDWLTVSQAAARLGITPRAVQKRCKVGTVVARRKGARWEVAAHSLQRLDSSPGAPAVAAAGEAQEPRNANQNANSRTDDRHSSFPVRESAHPTPDSQHKSPEAEFAAARTALEPGDAKGREGTHMSRELAENRIAYLEREVLFLRGVVEQHQISEAELRGALRGALRALPRAITAPDGTPDASTVSQPMEKQTDADAAVGR